jgi:two-component system CheB/CheR fusion protein
MSDHPMPAPAVADAAATGCRILIVDDDADVRESLGVLLELDGHQIAYAHDGEEAIRREAEFEPALVLLDLGLPDIDGHDVARRIRARGSHARIVALTGSSGPDQGVDFDARVIKPARIQELTAYLP